MTGPKTVRLITVCLALTATGTLGCADDGQWILVPPDGGDVRDDGGSGDGPEDGTPEDGTPEDVVAPGDTGEVPDVACEFAPFAPVETQETFTVPPGARFMYIKAWGAGGNGETM